MTTPTEPSLSTVGTTVSCKLRVFENRVLRRIFGHKRDEVTVEWRKLHNEELNDLYCSLNMVWVITSRMRWKDNIKIDLQ